MSGLMTDLRERGHTMFKPSKKKSPAKGKETVDFKLEFHASRVPQRGWDKLLVSLIYLETGKVTAKTGKVSVKNGHCQWSEPLYESIHVSRDPKGKDADKELYKIVVSMGLSRFGILGETTINLADHVQAIVPVSLSLQLQNCNSGSILHVKIQRIMGKSFSRDLEDAKESTLEEEGSQPATSDGQQDKLDSKPFGPKIVGSLQVSKTVDLPESNKDEACSPSIHRYSSDSLDIPLTPGGSESRPCGRDALGEGSTSPSSSMSSSSGRPESGNGFNDYIGVNRTGIDQEFPNEISSSGMNTKPSRSVSSHNYTPVRSARASSDGTGKQIEQRDSPELSVWGSPASFTLGSTHDTPENFHEKGQETGHKSNHTQRRELDAAEVTIRELRAEAASWEQHRKVLETDIESLKQLQKRELDAAEVTIRVLRAEAASWEQHRKVLETDIESLKQLQRGELDAAEVTIGELRAEAASSEQHRKVLEMDVESLKQLLDDEKKRGVDLHKQLCALVAERDCINEEMNNLKFKSPANVAEGQGWQNVKRSTVRELQDELEYEKSVNSNLNLQLRKTQESNSELLLEIQDLEKLLVEKEAIEKEMNEIQALSDSRITKSADSDEDLRKVVEALKKELEELERDSQELTEENLDLISQLREANNKLYAKDRIISQLESRKTLVDQYHFKSTDAYNASLEPGPVEAEKLREMVNSLREKLKRSEDSSERKLASSRTLIDELNSSILLLRSKNSDLEMELQSSEDRISLLLEDIENLRNEIDDHQKETLLLASQKGQLKGLREKATKAEQDCTNALKRSEELEAMNERLKDEYNKAIATLEQQLKSAEERALGTDESHADALQVMGNLKAENLELAKEMSLLFKAKEEADSHASDLQEMIVVLQDQLNGEQLKSSTLLQEKLRKEAASAQLLQELYACQSQSKNMEHNTADFEIQRKEMQEEKMLSRSQIKELEMHIAVLEEEKHSVQDSRSAFEAKVEDLQSINEELREKLQSAREEGAWARENTNTLVQEIRALEAEIESGKLRMERSVSELEGQKAILQSQVENLSEANLHMEEKVSDCEAQYRKAMKEKAALLVSLQEKETASKEHDGSLQTVIKQQQDKIQTVQKEIREASRSAEDKRKVIWDLNSTIENMKQDLASKELSHSNLQEQLQKLIEEKIVSAAKIAALNDELSKLHKDIEEKEKTFSDEIKVLLLSNEELKLKADKTEEMLRRSTSEKATAVFCLQQEIKQLSNQMSSSCDDKEKLVTQALSEASVLRANKVDLEEKLGNLQENLKQANKDAVSLKEDLEFKVDEALLKEMEMARKLEQALIQVQVLQQEKHSCTERMAELERQCIAVKEEKENMASQISAIQNRAGESVFWRTEADKARNELAILRQQMIEAEMSAEKAAEEVESLKERVQSQEEAARFWKKSKAAPEEKIARLQQEANAKGAKRPLEEKNESNKLRKQTSDLKRKLSEQEVEKDELKKRVSYLEEELQHKANALVLAERKLKDRDPSANGGRPVSLLARSLSRANGKVEPMSPSRYSKELAELREKVNCLEDDVKIKAAELEALNHRLKQQHTSFSIKIEHLELANKQLVEEHSHSNLDQDVKEEKKELESVLPEFNAAAKGENMVKRLSTLETELSELTEANNMYKSQLQSAFAMQQNVHAAALESLGSVDQVIKDLAELKRKNVILEEELGDMRERYFNMSLKFAEVEAEREELVMTIRNLRGAKKLMPHRSANF